MNVDGYGNGQGYLSLSTRLSRDCPGAFYIRAHVVLSFVYQQRMTSPDSCAGKNDQD